MKQVHNLITQKPTEVTVNIPNPLSVNLTLTYAGDINDTITFTSEIPNKLNQPLTTIIHSMIPVYHFQPTEKFYMLFSDWNEGKGETAIVVFQLTNSVPANLSNVILIDKMGTALITDSYFRRALNELVQDVQPNLSQLISYNVDDFYP